MSKKIVFFVGFLFLFDACSSAVKDRSFSDKVTNKIEESSNASILNLANSENFSAIDKVFNLSETQKNFLEREGFVIMDMLKFDNFQRAYALLKERGLPMLITSDVVLQIFHRQFADSLKDLEEEILFSSLWELVWGLEQKAAEARRETNDESLRQAYRFLDIYLGITLTLLMPESEQISGGISTESAITNNLFTEEEKNKYSYGSAVDIGDAVKAEVALIRGHAGFAESPLFSYREDYAKYVPRGHYGSSEHLKNYFRAMTWLGRMGFLLNGGCKKCLISEEKSRLQTAAAILLADLINDNKELGDKWAKIYTITGFYAGSSDDYTVADYSNMIDDIFGEAALKSEIFEKEYSNVAKKLQEVRRPRIYGGSGKCAMIEDAKSPDAKNFDLEECLGPASGLRLFGMRFSFDTFLLQNLVYPNVGVYNGDDPKPFTASLAGDDLVKGLPRGLELFELLGSQEARNILEQSGDSAYEGYGKQFNKLRAYISNIPDSEAIDLSWQWIMTLKDVVLSQEKKSLFMKSPFWVRKDLITALASWTNLKHDTILYTKQGYTPIRVTMAGSPDFLNKKPQLNGFIEPRPELYKKLKMLYDQLEAKLTEANIVNEKIVKQTEMMRGLLDQLSAISEKELDGTELVPEDYDFINNFDRKLQQMSGFESDSSVVIADLFTDLNEGQLLEEATGNLRFLIVVYDNPKGGLSAAVGPMSSYYEFKQAADQPLNDEQWKEILNSEKGSVKPLDWQRME